MARRCIAVDVSTLETVSQLRFVIFLRWNFQPLSTCLIPRIHENITFRYHVLSVGSSGNDFVGNSWREIWNLVSCKTDGITENWTFPCFIPILSGFFSFYWRILSEKVSKLTSLTWALPYSEGINAWIFHHVNFLQWKFDPYQFFWYQLFVFRIPTDLAPRFL